MCGTKHSKYLLNHTKTILKKSDKVKSQKIQFNDTFHMISAVILGLLNLSLYMEVEKDPNFALLFSNKIKCVKHNFVKKS